MLKKLLVSLLLINSFGLHAQRMPECWYKSVASFENGQYDKALSWIDSCLFQNQNIYQYWLQKGEILLNQKMYDNAIDAFFKSEKLKNGSASFYLARTFCLMGDTSLCFKWIKTNLTSEFRVKESIIKLEPGFHTISSSIAWTNLWDREWYSTYDKRIAEIEYNTSNTRWDDALDLLNQKIKGNSNHQLFYLRARIYFELGSYRLAADDISKAIKKNKRNSDYLMQRAKVYIAQNKLPNALKDVKSAINLVGTNPKYIKELAIIYYLSKMYQNAFDDINFYLDFYHSDIDALAIKVKTAIELNLFVDALFEINKLIKVDLGNPEYHYLRGLCYFKTQNYSFAEDDFSQSIKKNYRLDESYYYRGLTKFYQSKLSEACSDWDNALKNGNFKSQELLYKHCNKSTKAYR